MQMLYSAKLAVAWCTMFVVGTELFVFSPLLPILAVDYQISAATAGLTVALFSITYMLSAPLLGHAADRLGRRRVLVSSLFAFAAANMMTATAANVTALLAARVFAGAAAAGISPTIYALVGSAAPAERRATWLALVVSGLLLSLACGASIGGLVGGSLGWQPVFAVLAGFGFVLAWLNRWVWPNERGGSAAVEAAAPALAATPLLVRRLVPMVLWSTGLYAVYIYLGAGLKAAGLSPGQSVEAIFFYGCGAIAGVLIGGRMADRLGVKLTAGVSFAGLSACLLLLRLALDMSILVGPALGLCSAVAQLFFPAQQSGLASEFPRQRSAAFAWNNSALFFGISLGSLVGGQAIALANFNTNLAISAGIALLGCAVNAIVVPGRSPLRVIRATYLPIGQ